MAFTLSILRSNAEMEQIHRLDCHDSVIDIDQVSFAYNNSEVIKNLSFQVFQRDFIGLIGANGAGKTTLLKMIVGLLKPDQGQVRLFGQAVSKFKDWERIGYVPQRNSFNPLFPATVEEVVMSGLYHKKKMLRRITKADQLKCIDAMHALGIEDLSKKLIGRLSGGQQQRVFLARALINSPDLLILDEPTVGIDAETQEIFFHMIRHMHQQHDITFIMVSHDLAMMKAYLGSEPKQSNGKIGFYAKHSHELEACVETDLAHTLRGLRNELEHEKEEALVTHR